MKTTTLTKITSAAKQAAMYRLRDGLGSTGVVIAVAFLTLVSLVILNSLLGLVNLGGQSAAGVTTECAI